MRRAPGATSSKYQSLAEEEDDDDLWDDEHSVGNDNDNGGSGSGSGDSDGGGGVEVDEDGHGDRHGCHGAARPLGGSANVRLHAPGVGSAVAGAAAVTASDLDDREDSSLRISAGLCVDGNAFDGVEEVDEGGGVAVGDATTPDRGPRDPCGLVWTGFMICGLGFLIPYNSCESPSHAGP